MKLHSTQLSKDVAKIKTLITPWSISKK